jgi:hypothetical protein
VSREPNGTGPAVSPHELLSHRVIINEFRHKGIVAFCKLACPPTRITANTTPIARNSRTPWDESAWFLAYYP